MLKARGIRMAFGGAEVLKGVDLELLAGEVHALVGANGAGKSTLGRIIAGVHPPAEGSLVLNGADISLASPRDALDLGIALIHQEPMSFPDLSVAENIFVGRMPISKGRINWNEAVARAESALRRVGSKLDPRRRVRGLSIADQQMVELAAALAHEAKILILDETTASLTPKEVDELFSVIRTLASDGHAVGFVTHRLNEVFSISDRISVLRDGEKVADLETSTTTSSEVIRMMVGEHQEVESYLPASGPGEPLIEIRNVNGVSFTVRAGEIVGLAGLVGAGRSELARAIFGIDPIGSGEILVRGVSTRIRSPRDAMQNGIAFVPENRQREGLLMPMSISTNTTLAVLREIASRGITQRDREERVSEAETSRLNTRLRSVGQPVSELSGGNQQKVVLAKWLLTKPQILIVDEPTRGVDVGAKAEVHRILRALADEGIAVLLISSEIPEILSLSDRILVMQAGRITSELSRQEATSEKIMLAASGAAVA